jgi:hypothetical protein
MSHDVKNYCRMIVNKKQRNGTTELFIDGCGSLYTKGMRERTQPFNATVQSDYCGEYHF